MKKLSVFIVCLLFLVSLPSSSFALALNDEEAVRESVVRIQSPIPALSGVSEETQKGVVWVILSRIFWSDGKIYSKYLEAFKSIIWNTNNIVPVWNGVSFVAGNIRDLGTEVRIGSDVKVSWDITADNFYKTDGSRIGGKFVDGTNSSYAVYNGGNVGIGTSSPGYKLTVMGSSFFQWNTKISWNLFLAWNLFLDGFLSGDSIQQGTLDGSEIQDGTIQSIDIQNNSLTSVDIKDGSITWSDLGADSIGAVHIRDGVVRSAEIMNGTIQSIDVQDASLRWADIAPATITGIHIANGSIFWSDIAKNTLGYTHIKEWAIRSVEIANGTIQSIDIKDKSITGADIANNTVTWDNILNASIKGRDLENNTVGSNKLADSVLFTSVRSSSYCDKNGRNCLTVPPSCSGSNKALGWTGSRWVCNTVSGSSSSNLDLAKGLHSSAQCSSLWGSVTNINGNKVCKFNRSSCPSGWTRWGNWSTTSSKTCNNGVHQDCDGQGWTPVSCTTWGHSWWNTATENCLYISAGIRDGSAGCNVTQRSTCWATVTQIACY